MSNLPSRQNNRLVASVSIEILSCSTSNAAAFVPAAVVAGGRINGEEFDEN